MARRGSVAGIIMAMARESARHQRIAATNAARQQRDQVRQERQLERKRRESEREYFRTKREAEKAEKTRYLEDRLQSANESNEDVQQYCSELQGVLSHTLSIDDTITFKSLLIAEKPPRLSIPKNLKEPAPQPQEDEYLRTIVAPGVFASLWPGVKRSYEQALANARHDYATAVNAWNASELKRLQELTSVELDHQKAVAQFEQKKANRAAEVASFEADYKAGDPDAVIAYNTMVLERSVYPEGFPKNFSIAFTQASKQLIVEFELPSASVIPSAMDFRYVRASDSIVGRPRKQSEIRDLYRDVVASVALRTIHEIFESDQGGHIETVCFNGYVRTIDLATGRDIQPHLVSVRVTKDRFSEIDLSRVDKATCLRNLGAQVSRQPDEAVPVKPIVEFNMADARFIDQTDLVSGLSSAMNLMELNPYEFEQLVANLFGQMGLESKLTRSSRDGGVDCVAYDKRPVLGGKVVIQAKRYRHTVGVSAVRDLYGTMMNEGANKGILVTTSGYGPDAFDFAKDKPIELIEGGGLLYLLQEVGVQARIIFPETA